eukprot:TRINITY_DN8002_c0_g1_i1.p3 TRINITY_DN8002_c0_g1~~TRINITY_DN8002_c0_g1_i1.p3  ORF type:complete len:125 (-),score=12.77 TRINITY_DN8002_c0_g1_i1:437-811(-)
MDGEGKVLERYSRRSRRSGELMGHRMMQGSIQVASSVVPCPESNSILGLEEGNTQKKCRTGRRKKAIVGKQKKVEEDSNNRQKKDEKRNKTTEGQDKKKKKRNPLKKCYSAFLVDERQQKSIIR